MSDEWAPNAPEINKQFKKASEGKEKTALPTNSDGIVTKKEIEALEKQIKAAAPEMHLTPPGARPTHTAQEQRMARLEKMRQKMKSK